MKKSPFKKRKKDEACQTTDKKDIGTDFGKRRERNQRMHYLGRTTNRTKKIRS